MRETSCHSYEGVESWKRLSTLYRVARLYINFFQPTMKLLSKSRDGAHVYRQYDKDSTPYALVLKSLSVPEANKERLRRDYEKLDPVLLLSEIERIQKELWATAVNQRETKAVVEPLPQQEKPSTAYPSQPNRSKPSPTKQRPRRNRKGPRCGTPSPPGKKRGPKTNLDAVWSEVLQELEQNPTMSPGAVLSLLDSRYPGKFRRTQINSISDRLRR